jgi:hypothetical protein
LVLATLIEGEQARLGIPAWRDRTTDTVNARSIVIQDGAGIGQPIDTQCIGLVDRFGLEPTQFLKRGQVPTTFQETPTEVAQVTHVLAANFALGYYLGCIDNS